MLERFKDMNNGVLNVIVYCNSASLEWFLRGIIRDNGDYHKSSIINVKDSKELVIAKGNTKLEPLVGGKWLTDISCDVIPFKELVVSLNQPTPSGLTVYWTSKYKIYKDLTSLDIVKKMGGRVVTMYLGRLSSRDIRFIYDSMYGDRGVLSDKLLKFVCDSYMYDIQAVFDLFSMLNAGYEFETTKDITEAIGVGGNTIDSFVIRLLTTNCSQKGVKRVLSNRLKLLDDLSNSYNYRTIQSIMKSVVSSIIDIKQLQIMGYYRKVNNEIPENYDSKKLSRLKRYERLILNEITLARVLNLKLLLDKHNNFDSRLNLVNVLLDYIDLVTEEV